MMRAIPSKFDWSAQQLDALEVIERWRASDDDDVLRVFGFAGTGKTTLIQYLVSTAGPGCIRVGALTGKAAQVLRDKGVRGAQTIHSMIYRSQLQSTQELLEVEEALKTATGAARKLLLKRKLELEKYLNNLKFMLNPMRSRLGRVGMRSIGARIGRSVETNVEMIIIDECSMVDRKIAEDLQSFGIKVLVFGDPMQLGPFGNDDEGNRKFAYYMGVEPDVMLTEIHRQALDSSIIQMSMRVREGKSLAFGKFGDCEITRFKPARWWEKFDQALTGKRETKSAFDRQVRRGLGIMSPIPVAGEKLMCLRNNHEKGLLNGSQWVVLACEEVPNNLRYVYLTLKSMIQDVEIQCFAWRDIFILNEARFLRKYPVYQWRLSAEMFDFCYAITVHRAQGSEWDRVILIDESGVWERDGTHLNWLYTGITRAAKQLTILR